MLKKALGLGLITSVIGLGGAISYADETKTTERQIPVVKCSEPAYSIMVMEFDCKASACQQAKPDNPRLLFIYEALAGSGGVQGVGKGLTTMLTNALKTTNCFRIVDLEQ